MNTTHRVFCEVPILVNRLFFPKQGLLVSVDNLVTQLCTLGTREAVLKCPFAVCDCLNG